jgi:hypothetical protein
MVFDLGKKDSIFFGASLLFGVEWPCGEEVAGWCIWVVRSGVLQSYGGGFQTRQSCR